MTHSGYSSLLHSASYCRKRCVMVPVSIEALQGGSATNWISARRSYATVNACCANRRNFLRQNLHGRSTSLLAWHSSLLCLFLSCIQSISWRQVSLRTYLCFGVFKPSRSEAAWRKHCRQATLACSTSSRRSPAKVRGLGASHPEAALAHGSQVGAAEQPTPLPRCALPPRARPTQRHRR